jgi:hypothetical protein
MPIEVVYDDAPAAPVAAAPPPAPIEVVYDDAPAAEPGLLDRISSMMSGVGEKARGAVGLPEPSELGEGAAGYLGRATLAPFLGIGALAPGEIASKAADVYGRIGYDTLTNPMNAIPFSAIAKRGTAGIEIVKNLNRAFTVLQANGAIEPVKELIAQTKDAWAKGKLTPEFTKSLIETVISGAGVAGGVAGEVNIGRQQRTAAAAEAAAKAAAAEPVGPSAAVREAIPQADIEILERLAAAKARGLEAVPEATPDPSLPVPKAKPAKVKGREFTAVDEELARILAESGRTPSPDVVSPSSLRDPSVAAEFAAPRAVSAEDLGGPPAPEPLPMDVATEPGPVAYEEQVFRGQRQGGSIQETSAENGQLGPGRYFTQVEPYAQSYADGSLGSLGVGPGRAESQTVHSGRIRLENPLRLHESAPSRLRSLAESRIDPADSRQAALLREVRNPRSTAKDVLLSAASDSNDIRQIAESLGYDGIISDKYGQEVVSFKPDQFRPKTQLGEMPDATGGGPAPDNARYLATEGADAGPMPELSPALQEAIIARQRTAQAATGVESSAPEAAAPPKPKSEITAKVEALKSLGWGPEQLRNLTIEQVDQIVANSTPPPSPRAGNRAMAQFSSGESVGPRPDRAGLAEKQRAILDQLRAGGVDMTAGNPAAREMQAFASRNFDSLTKQMQASGDLKITGPKGCS